jgi:hypothetical protein
LFLFSIRCTLYAIRYYSNCFPKRNSNFPDFIGTDFDYPCLPAGRLQIFAEFIIPAYRQAGLCDKISSIEFD